MDKKKSCEETCVGYATIGLEACLGCTGDYDFKQQLRIMARRILRISGELRADGRCKHGMMPGQCSYCAGMAPTKYAQSIGAAWIR